MELKLNIYKTKSLKEVEKTYSINDFKLSFGSCEDILNAINIDMFVGGGLDALSDESRSSEIFKIIVNSLPVFKDLLKDIYEGLTDDELKRTDLTELVSVVKEIIAYSITLLGKALNKQKN